MKTTECVLWMETTTGRRSVLASTPCRLYAMLLGEALWTHGLQLHMIALPLRLLEVWEQSSSGDTITRRMLARWSASGREHMPHIARSHERQAEETPTQHVHRVLPSGAEPQNDEASSLSCFFPTEEEWTAWKTWKEESDV